MEYINRCSCTNTSCQKILTKAILLLAPTANMLGTSHFFIGCIEWQHAFFGVDLGNGRDYKFSSRLTDGTPHSSLTCFNVFFSLLLGQFVLTPTYFPSHILWDKVIVSPIEFSNSPWTKIFQVKVPSSL